jgi:hypothetical protein
LKRAPFHETPQRLGSQLFPAETRRAVSRAFQARFTPVAEAIKARHANRLYGPGRDMRQLSESGR